MRKLITRICLTFIVVGFISGNSFAENENWAAKAIRHVEAAQKLSKDGLYDKALNELFIASRIYEYLKDHRGLAKTYNSIGLIYIEIKEFEQSRAFYNKAIAELTLEPDKRMQSYVLNNIGMLVENIGQNDSALFFYEQSLTIKKELHDSLGISKTLTNLGAINVKLGHYRQGLVNYNQSLKLKLLLGDSVGIATAYSNIADAFGWMGLLDSTQYYLDIGMPYVRRDVALPLLVIYYKNYMALYNALGDFQKAVIYSDSLMNVEKRIFHQTLSDELARQQVIYETDKKDYALKTERSKNQLLEEKQRREYFGRIILFLVSGALLVFTLLLVHILRIRSKQIAQNRLLFEKEKKLLETISLKTKAENELLEMEVELKTKELLASSTLMLSKQEIIADLRKQIEAFSQKNGVPSDELMAKINETYRSSINLEQEWDRFQKHFNSIHGAFFERLRSMSVDLTEADLRHCAYIKIGLTTKEISALLNIEPSSVQKSRVRLKKKLDLPKDKDLQDFIRFDIS